MKKKYNPLSTTCRVIGQVSRLAPFSSTLGIIACAISGFIPAAVIYISAELIDISVSVIQGTAAIEQLYILGAILLSIFIFEALIRCVIDIVINTFVWDRYAIYAGQTLFNKMAQLPLIAYENAEVMNDFSRAKDGAHSVSQLHCDVFCNIPTFIIRPLSITVVLASYNIWFIPIAILSVLPYFFITLIRGKELFEIKYKQAKKDRRKSYLWELLTKRQSIKEMRVTGSDTYITNRWIDTQAEVNEELWNQGKKELKSVLLCDILVVLGYIGSLALALYLVIIGNITVGVFSSCIVAFATMQQSVKLVFRTIAQLPEEINYANNYFKILDLTEEEKGSVPFAGLKSSIELDNVSFSYPNCDTLALDGVSLSIDKGEKIAIIGENGSGKTTITKLLLGLYPQKDGEVRYDGLSVYDFNKESFLKQVSVISQNYQSYQMTTRENIGLSDYENFSNDEKIARTIEEVGINGLVDLDEVLGREFGDRDLSGGEWQKIAIARGLFKDSEIIVLDEPTSALDPLVETSILKNFLEIAKDKTAIIISHRVGLTKLVDKIVVMKEGRIVEIGSHNELMSKHGEYEKLYNSQQQWYI